MIAVGLSLAAALLAATPTGAHHTFSMYDQEKLVTYEGTVARFQWTNPHTYADVDVQTPKGVVRHGFEAPNNGWLKKHGWTRSSLKPGDQVKVVAHPLRNGNPGGAMVEVILTDGRKLSLGWGELSKDTDTASSPASTTP